MEEVLTAENVIDLGLRDGRILKFKKGVKPVDILNEINKNLSDKAVAVKFNGELIDLTTELNESGDLEVLTADSKEGMEVFWHSSAHLLAHAVKRLYPDAKLGFGPPISNGFYYDIDFGKSIVFEDLSRIESEMKKISEENLSLKREVLKREEAINLLKV